MSLRERIQNADDRPTTLVEIPEWDATVAVRPMTGRQRVKFVRDLMGGQIADTSLYGELLVACCADPDTGDALFTDADVEWLVEKSGAALERVAGECLVVSGLRNGQEDAEGKGF